MKFGLELFSDYNANLRLIEYLKLINDELLAEDADEPPEMFELGAFDAAGEPLSRRGYEAYCARWPKGTRKFERADPSDPKDARLPKQTWEQEQRYRAFEDQQRH